ncbi:MAG: AAA family ATPase, partial [Cyanobacteria bacterium J06588_4]
ADLGISNFEITQKDFVKYLFFKHEIDSSVKDFDERLESEGTRQFIAIMYEIIQSLSAGHLTILDEIEIKLHQNIVAYIIGLFQNKYENPHGAQLIFSFHNTYFMDILEPNQLWFTEKNDRGQTKIFSAADFKDIKKLQQRSLEELYRLGRFGAKPRGI